METDLQNHTSEIKITDLGRIIEVANPTTLGFNFDQAFWRGHGVAEWLLRPHVFRRDFNERALMGYFQMRAPTRSHARTPEPHDYFGWLFLAQHYGLPTRLLDWTENPLVALYFAVEGEGERDKDGCIWALWPCKLNDDHDLVAIRGSKAIELARAAFVEGTKCDDVIVAIDGREIDLRMLVQIGRFTLHTYPTAIEHLPGSAAWLRKYIVPKERKQRLRDQLAVMGIGRSNLFPDLPNLAAELRGTRFT
jgi:hypothetical protein